MKRIHVLIICILVLGATGCSTSSHVVVGDTRSPISPDEVRIYSSPPKEYEEIAILSSSSANAWAFTSQGKTDAAVSRLKEEAASLGANGILLQGVGDERGGAVHTGNVYGGTSTAFASGVSVPVTHKRAGGIAIYVIEQ